MNNIVFSCNADSKGKSFPHFWEHTVGSGHARLALRSDWQQQLLKCKTELGFKYVRFHGMLSDDMGTLKIEKDKKLYSFFNIDQIFDFLLSIDMKPFVELSFMPSAIASGTETVFNYKSNITAPKKIADWGELLHKLVSHWVARYGRSEVRKWFFEVWNEPNLKAFWTGTRKDYFKFYRHSVSAIKKVDSHLQVGGPATAANKWIAGFLTYCKKNSVPVDFISTHHYPTDAFGKPGDDTIAQLAKSKRSVLREQAARSKKHAGKKPVYYTEWSTSSNPFDMLHDLPYAAAFITKTVLEAQGLVAGYSYWTFSDIFEENYFSSVPFHGGFGLMNIYGIPKPAYRAFELLHRLSETRIEVEGTGNGTVDAWAFRKNECTQLLIVNTALPRHAISEETITFNIKTAKKIKRAFIERVDDLHANATRHWIESGSPQTLSHSQVEALNAASTIVKAPYPISFKTGYAVLQFSIPSQAIVCITLENK